MGRAENEVTAQIREILKILKIPHWKTWGSPLTVKGIPDLICCIPPHGRLLLIEVKSEKGTISEEQKEFLERFTNHGALAFVARSFHDVVKKLREIGYAPAFRIMLKI